MVHVVLDNRVMHKQPKVRTELTHHSPPTMSVLIQIDFGILAQFRQRLLLHAHAPRSATGHLHGHRPPPGRHQTLHRLAQPEPRSFVWIKPADATVEALNRAPEPSLRGSEPDSSFRAYKQQKPSNRKFSPRQGPSLISIQLLKSIEDVREYLAPQARL